MTDSLIGLEKLATPAAKTRLFSLMMRFRSKFGLVGWVFAANSLIFEVPWLLGSHMSLLDKILGILMPAVLLLNVLERYFVYWIVGQESVLEHRFGKEKIIPISDVLRIKGRVYWRMRPTQLRIDYFRKNEPLKNGNLHASPADISGFVEAVRRFAPATAIDV